MTDAALANTVRLMPLDRRRENLRQLIEQWGGPASLATKLGYSNASYLVQMAGPNPTRPITEKTARKFEARLDLPIGWLDGEHNTQPPADINVELVTKAVTLAGLSSEALGIRLPPAKFADVVAILYQEAIATGKLDADLARRILQLAK